MTTAFSIAISCPVTRWHQEHIVPKEAQIQHLLWDISKSWSLSVLCHSTAGCAILSVYSQILVLLKAPYFSIPVCLLLCGKEQDTNTLLEKALKKGSWGAVPIIAAMITVESLTATAQTRAVTGLISNQNTHRNKKSTWDWNEHPQFISQYSCFQISLNEILGKVFGEAVFHKC